MLKPFLTCRLLMAGVIAVCLLPFSIGQPAADSLTTDAECPLIPGCCEEDCCGEGTSWDESIQYCVVDADSAGFNGTHSDEWENGCVERVCCGATCCTSELSYDEEAALCLPDTTVVSLLPTIPESYTYNGTYESDGRIGFIPKMDVSEILSHCSNNRAVYLNEANDNSVKLCPNLGTSTKGNVQSFTLDDDKAISIECPEETNPGADCQVTYTGFLLPTGSSCVDDAQCETGYCHDSNDGDNPQCTCNPATNEGCSGEYECYGSATIRSERDTQEVLKPAPSCYLPPGATCEPFSQFGQCLTFTCNPSTSTCGCNEFTDYPCNVNSEICARSNDDFSCLPAIIHTIEPGEDDLFEREVFEIYEQCSNGEEVYLRRSWPVGRRMLSHAPSTNKRSFTLLCSGQEVIKVENTYNFTLEDERSILINCPNNSSSGNPVCRVTGNGLLSDRGEGCITDTDCLDDLHCTFYGTYPSREYVGMCADEGE